MPNRALVNNAYISLVKDTSGNICDIENYHAITLSPVIAKLFESVLVYLCEESLNTNALQFGFKRNSSCADAIFTLADHSTNGGSSVFAASLDIGKAFDKVNHFKLYECLLTSAVPWFVVDILSNWYSTLFCAVRWNSRLSVSDLTMGWLLRLVTGGHWW